MWWKTKDFKDIWGEETAFTKAWGWDRVGQILKSKSMSAEHKTQGS